MGTICALLYADLDLFSGTYMQLVKLLGLDVPSLCLADLVKAYCGRYLSRRNPGMGCILCILLPMAVSKYVRVFPILCLIVFIQLIQVNAVYTIPKCYHFKSLFHHRTDHLKKKQKRFLALAQYC